MNDRVNLVRRGAAANPGHVCAAAGLQRAQMGPLD
jgi:hypothetical protein